MGELSFLELRSKEIINACDGRRLGRLIDLIFTDDGKVKGIIVPYTRRGLFGKSQDVYVPFNCIQKIGEDVIIVDAQPEGCGDGACGHKPPHGGHGRAAKPPEPDCLPDGECDGRCEKCMLFDCAYRWKEHGHGPR